MSSSRVLGEQRLLEAYEKFERMVQDIKAKHCYSRADVPAPSSVQTSWHFIRITDELEAALSELDKVKNDPYLYTRGTLTDEEIARHLSNDPYCSEADPQDEGVKCALSVGHVCDHVFMRRVK